MTDPRLEKLARLLVDYSLGLRKGQWLTISGPAPASPLIREVYRVAMRRGAFVETLVAIDGLSEILFQEASPEQLQHILPTRLLRTRRADAQLSIRGDVNTRSLTSADPKRQAMWAAAQKRWRRIFFDRAAKGQLHWVLTQWPTHANAQDAEMSLSEYEDFIFGAGHLDDDDPVKTWRTISRSQQALTNRLNKARSIRIVAADTDITLSVKGRKWINSCGHENFPDGEIFTGPVETDVEGHIRYSFPSIHPSLDREVDNVFLEFRQGKVVVARADKGEDFLREMVDMDAGSSRLGELAFGTNYHITRYTRNGLFDEKIGGTVHLALGAGYPETGNRNSSGLHWDMVCDLRTRGKIFADGELISENGRFLDKRYPQPPGEGRSRKSARRR